MDKTLEIVITAAVLMVIAAVLFFMLSDRSSGFNEETGDRLTGSECKILKAKWEMASSTSEKEDIESDAEDIKGCDPTNWISSEDSS